VTGSLTPADIELHARLGIDAALLGAAGVCRVTDAEARRLLSSRHPGDLAGVVYPYRDPLTNEERTYRLRRDHHEMENGKPRDKYLSAFGDMKRLYFPPCARELQADPTVLVILVEAEKSVLAILAAAQRTGRRVLVVGTGGCWGWCGRIGKTTDADGARVDEKGPLPDLDRIVWNGRDVVVLFDSNAATNLKVQTARRRLAKDLANRGARVRVGDVPAEDGVNGPDDFLAKHGDVALFQLLDSARPDAPAGKRAKPEKPKQGREVLFEDAEPWPQPVDGAALLDRLASTCSRYLALPDHASAALALWVLHAYTFEAWFTSPILAITSPVKRCGKTLLLAVLGALVPRRLFASNVTPAVLFRTIEKYAPTLLIDEADTFIRDSDELRGVLNSGHTRTTAVVIRAVGEDHDPRQFSTWCPKAIALIGKLPDTLGDRAIEVAMRRRMAGERVERLRQDRIESECLELRCRAVRWAADHVRELQDADPQVPVALHDRAADCWRPLIAIAEAAGGDWPSRARDAAQALSGVTDEADQPLPVLLLADVRTVFDAKGVDAMPSSELVKSLCALDSRPWATLGKDNKGLTTHALARLLTDFRIHPTKIRFGDDTARSYARRMFEDAWARYRPSEVEHRNIVNESGLEPRISEVEQPLDCSSPENAVFPNKDGVCSSVPVQTGESGHTGDDWEAMW
jgi:putative DNA primase/helicase